MLRALRLVIAVGLHSPLVASAADGVSLGVARVDVTPTEPIRLTGYASRQAPHVGVEQKLWAKALAIGTDAEGPAVLVTLDNCGIAEETWREVRDRLGRSAGIRPDRVVIASSHTHSAPATAHWAPNIFVRDLSPAELGAIDRYTVELIAKLEGVARAALAARQPGRLSWAQGSATFAANRRTRGGPVDHALPVLKAERPDGTLLALVANYACHCTTLGGDFNRACGDWAGYAQEAIEREAPGAVALITIGCGADANPSPRGGADGGLAFAKTHGGEMGTEVKRLLGLNFTALKEGLTTRAREIELPFGPQFTRDQWLTRSTNAGIVGYHAKKWLARLDRGEKLPSTLYYPITTWNFGDDLAMVFLPGEVVVDYALRLKRELDSQRLWVSGYANYVPCYIPSRRILGEGGYEAEESLWYYDRPARLSTNAEDLIIGTVRDLVPPALRTDPKKAERPDARSPQQALGMFRLSRDLAIELVAAEPMVQSPVAIDWDAQGRLWVCEMYDYPSGLNPPVDANRKYGEPLREPPGGFTPGGRIKVLTDTNGDGRFDQATVFLDRIPFPTGVMPWRQGALICAAPNILYAKDADGDGRADLVQTNVTGFATHNYQARVNGFTWGLDGWLHGSSGLFGGKVKVLATGREVDLSGRDFRYRPDTGELEPVAGISQMGRVRDEFDQWFGNDNSTLLWHYPLPDHYLRRNPHVVYPAPRVLVAGGDGMNRLYPASRTLTRFNDPQMANIVTSACGPEIYRDDVLGADYHGNAFICEPVHNLVRRLVLEPSGVTFVGRRAAGEERGEFLASTDNWFRPVQVRTGPDGGLYVVDMYRFVVEHPRWIPLDRLKELEVRAGADKGRIYRVSRRGVPTRPVRNLQKAGDEELVRSLDTPNGPTRDLVHREMLVRGLPGEDRFGNDLFDATSGQAERLSTPGPFRGKRYLQGLIATSRSPAIQAQAVCLLGGDSIFVPQGPGRDPRVRRLAVRLAEPGLATGRLADERFMTLLRLATNGDPVVRFQVALTLGDWKGTNATQALIDLAKTDDPWQRAAVLSSAASRAGALLEAVSAMPEGPLHSSDWIGKLVATALGAGSNVVEALVALAPKEDVWADADAGARLEPWRLEAIGSLMDGLRKQAKTVSGLATAAELDEGGRNAAQRIEAVLKRAGKLAADPKTDGPRRVAAMGLLGASDSKVDVEILAGLLGLPALSEWHDRAVAALSRSRQTDAGELLLAGWDGYAPSLRARVVDALVARPEWASQLVAALERDQVRPGEVSAAQRQRLFALKNVDVRERAKKVLATSVAGSRAEALRKFEGVPALTGSPQRGTVLFDQYCAQCHSVRGHGHDVGPNLAEFAGKGVQDFLLAVLDPNAGINPNFLAYTVETKDGRSLSGVVRNETASSLTLVQGGGVRESILRSDVAQLRAGTVSLMPEGLEQAMSPQDLADLIAWLKGVKPPVFGQATAAQAAEARTEFARSGPAERIEVLRAVERLPYPSWLGRWPLAYCRQNAGQEQLVWKAVAGVAAGGRTQFRFPAAMGLISDRSGEFALKVNGRAALSFNVVLNDGEWQSADGSVRMTYVVREANSEDACGELTIDLPAALAPSGMPAEFAVTGSASNSQRWFGIYLVDRDGVPPRTESRL